MSFTAGTMFVHNHAQMSSAIQEELLGRPYLVLLGGMETSAPAPRWLSDASQVFNGEWGNNNGSPSNYDAFTFPAYLAQGTYTVSQLSMVDTTRAIVKIADGDPGSGGITLADFDWYSAGGKTNNVTKSQTGVPIATSGYRTIWVMAYGKNLGSSGYLFGFTWIVFVKTA